LKKINYDRYFWQDDLVRLRGIEEKDWETHYYNRFDSEGRRLLNYKVELPPTEDEAKEMVERFKNFNTGSGRIMFTIENLDGEIVGGINLNSIDERNGTFSIGMQIDLDHRGKGYGTAAMRIVLRYAFMERRLNKYYGAVLENNTGSAKMLKKLGCTQEGIRRQMVFTRGKFMDEILFGLTSEEFREKENQE